LLSVVIPVLNGLPGLSAAIGAVVDLADEIVVVDGGSTDGSPAAAAALGARVVAAPRGRGMQLAAGASAARGDWLLFLHADTALSPGWRAAADRHMQDAAAAAGYFRLAFDEASSPARRTAMAAGWRARALGLPYGDQGLLIARGLYEAVGGYREIPLMEDVDIVRRIGRRRLRPLDAVATTSAARYRRDGWTRRSLRNLGCLALYFAGVAPERIARLYG